MADGESNAWDSPCLGTSVAELQPLTSNIEPLISNRNIPLLDTSLSSSKQRTSFFLIATRTPIGRYGAAQVPRHMGLPSRRQVEPRCLRPGRFCGPGEKKGPKAASV
jgi:hypothetical protein